MPNYGNTASIAQLSAPITAGGTSCTVSSFTGWPSANFWAVIARGTASAEIVLCTNVAGTTLTITRGQDGTVASSHGAGDTFEHIVPATHFAANETHIAATTAHGATGAVVGTTNAQTLTNKTYQGAHVSVFSDATPAGITSSFESDADSAAGRDGFVHKNTAGSATRRGFLLDQSGTPRFEVFNDGKVKLTPGATPGLQNVGTTQLDGALTANSTATLNGATSVNSTLGVTGAATLASATVSGNATVGGTLGVTGTTTATTVNATTVSGTTLAATGAVSGASVAATGAVTGASATLTGAVNSATVAASGAVTGASLATTGLITAWGGGRIVVVTSSLASITTPAVGDLVLLTTDNMLYRCTSIGPAVWLGVVHTSATEGHARYKNSATQSIPSLTARKVYLPTSVSTTADVTLTAGTTSTGSYFTLNRAGLWLIDGGVEWGSGAGSSIRSLSVSDDVLTTTWRASAGYNSTSGFDNAVSVTRRFAVNQKIGLWVYHECGSAVDLQAGEVTTLSLTWLGP